MSGRKRDIVHTEAERGYRVGLTRLAAERSFQVVHRETDLWLTTDDQAPGLAERVLAAVRTLRGQVAAQIALNPSFGASLAPVGVSATSPAIVRDMARAAACVGVGPMAAVAGAVAEHTAREIMQDPAAGNLLVENGGDCFLVSDRPRRVGLLDDPKAGTRLALALEAEDFPLALCASSARIGHSLSLGRADLAVVRATNAAAADAAATSLCNMLLSHNDVERALDQARYWAATPLPEEPALPGHPALLDGVFLSCGGRLGLWGAMRLAE